MYYNSKLLLLDKDKMNDLMRQYEYDKMENLIVYFIEIGI